MLLLSESQRVTARHPYHGDPASETDGRAYKLGATTACTAQGQQFHSVPGKHQYHIDAHNTITAINYPRANRQRQQFSSPQTNDNIPHSHSSVDAHGTSTHNTIPNLSNASSARNQDAQASRAHESGHRLNFHPSRRAALPRHLRDHPSVHQVLQKDTEVGEGAGWGSVEEMRCCRAGGGNRGKEG